MFDPAKVCNGSCLFSANLSDSSIPFVKINEMDTCFVPISKIIKLFFLI
jgi:hypothetical protein